MYCRTQWAVSEEDHPTKDCKSFYFVGLKKIKYGCSGEGVFTSFVFYVLKCILIYE